MAHGQAPRHIRTDCTVCRILDGILSMESVCIRNFRDPTLDYPDRLDYSPGQAIRWLSVEEVQSTAFSGLLEDTNLLACFFVQLPAVYFIIKGLGPGKFK